MRILLTGGGSGGHVFPLIAVTRKLREVSRPDYSRGEARPSKGWAARAQRKDALELLFIGPTGDFKDILQKEGISVKSIFTGKIRRYFSFLNFMDILQAPIGFIQAYLYIFLFMPDVIFAKGGYGSLPAGLISWMFRIPIVIHESDIVPGLSNKILSRVAKKIIVSFDEAASFFPKKKTIVLGNPVREELFFTPYKEALEKLFIKSDRPVLFVLGGSQGSREINDMILLALPDLVKKYEIIHQSGETDYKNMQKGANLQIKNEEEKGMYHLYPTLNEGELAGAYSVANVIISRAGSGAIFEIASSGKPSILIPYAPAAGAHQEKNAHAYAKTSAALMLEGKNVTPHMIVNTIDSIVNNPNKTKEMSEAARNFAKPEAARKIAAEILDII